MTFQTFLLKYGEIGIKGKNRHLFEDALVRQVRYALKDLDGEFEVHKSQARIYVDCEGAYDSDEVIERLQTVFGLVGICPVVRKPDQGFEQLKKEDPETDITIYALRTTVKSGVVPTVRLGRKLLINYDSLLDYLSFGDKR